jgi:glycosyltransferase involved in cell wall biosynthesis
MLLDDPCNVAAMADAIARLLRDERLRQEMATRGLARAQEFSWEQTARKTLEVYREFER